MPKSKSRKTVTLDAGSTRPPGTSSDRCSTGRGLFFPSVPVVPICPLLRCLEAAAPALGATPPRHRGPRKARRVLAARGAARRLAEGESTVNSSSPAQRRQGEWEGRSDGVRHCARAYSARAVRYRAASCSITLFSQQVYVSGSWVRTDCGGNRSSHTRLHHDGIVHNGEAKGADRDWTAKR